MPCLLFRCAVYLAALLTVCEGQAAIDLCLTEPVVSTGAASISHQYYPAWVTMEKCHCNITAQSNTELKTVVHYVIDPQSEKPMTRKCTSYMALRTWQRPSLYYVCPSSTLNTTATQFLMKGETLSIILQNPNIYRQKYYITVKVGSGNKVDVLCGGPLASPMLMPAFGGIPLDTSEPAPLRDKEGETIAIAVTVSILGVILAGIIAYVAYRWIKSKPRPPQKTEKRSTSGELINSVEDRSSVKAADNPGFINTPQSSMVNLSLDSRYNSVQVLPQEPSIAGMAQIKPTGFVNNNNKPYPNGTINPDWVPNDKTPPLGRYNNKPLSAVPIDKVRNGSLNADRPHTDSPPYNGTIGYQPPSSWQPEEEVTVHPHVDPVYTVPLKRQPPMKNNQIPDQPIRTPLVDEPAIIPHQSLPVSRTPHGPPKGPTPSNQPNLDKNPNRHSPYGDPTGWAPNAEPYRPYVMPHGQPLQPDVYQQPEKHSPYQEPYPQEQYKDPHRPYGKPKEPDSYKHPERRSPYSEPKQGSPYHSEPRISTPKASPDGADVYDYPQRRDEPRTVSPIVTPDEPDIYDYPQRRDELPKQNERPNILRGPKEPYGQYGAPYMEPGSNMVPKPLTEPAEERKPPSPRGILRPVAKYPTNIPQQVDQPQPVYPHKESERSPVNTKPKWQRPHGQYGQPEPGTELPPDKNPPPQEEQKQQPKPYRAPMRSDPAHRGIPFEEPDAYQREQPQAHPVQNSPPRATPESTPPILRDKQPRRPLSPKQRSRSQPLPVMPSMVTPFNVSSLSIQFMDDDDLGVYRTRTPVPFAPPPKRPHYLHDFRGQTDV